MYFRRYIAPCCPLTLIFNDVDELTTIKWQHQPLSFFESLTGFWQETLDNYFQGVNTPFPSPIFHCGTVFQQRVWQTIATIPYGKTATYGDIAHVLATSPRAVGQACGKNPLPIIIPCHRVVAKQGLGGFGLGNNESDLMIKKWLLNHENTASISY